MILSMVQIPYKIRLYIVLNYFVFHDGSMLHKTIDILYGILYGIFVGFFLFCMAYPGFLLLQHPRKGLTKFKNKVEISFKSMQ